MKKLVIFVAILAAMLAPMMLVLAQGQENGSGGAIIEGDFGGSVNFGALNPLRNLDTQTLEISGFLFPATIAGNPFTQTWGKAGDKGQTSSLATDWTVSDDGLTYTFTMRQDATWSDGTPITATDVKFSYDAVASGEIDSPLNGIINFVPEGNPTGIKELNIVDDYTFQVVFDQANCLALGNAGFPVVPAHAFGYTGQPDFDFSVMKDNPFDTDPKIVYGPFELASFKPGEAIALKALTTPWADGPVIPSGFVYRDVPDQTVLVEQFLAGETNYINGPPAARRADIRAASDVQWKDFPGNAWDYLAFNLADPTNPQPGLDANGQPIDQGHHPIFGDVRVRRAIQLATNVPDIIKGAVFGEGSQIPSAIIPTSWAYDKNLAPIPYDPDQAAQMLDDAGWPVGPDGTRVCKGCMYAEEGTPFKFTLVTNAGNTRRGAIGQIVQDELSKLGIQVDFQAIDFQTLLSTMYAEQYDAFILGWQQGFPDDPGTLLQLFGPSNDDPANQGSNFTSYNSPDFNTLITQANTVPGCDAAKRAEVFSQIQKLLQDDQPYVWLYVQNTMYAANKDVEGFDPQPNVPLWNANLWNIAAQ
jgi:peptide/nickel transport system substrate-binding protein